MTAPSTSTLTVTQLCSRIGARIDGVQLAGDLDAATVEQIRECAVAPQSDLLPRPAPPRRRATARLRRPHRHADRPPRGAAGEHADHHADQLRLRQGQPLAHRRHVRRELPGGVDPARGDPAELRRIDAVGLHRGGVRGAARAAQTPHRQPLGAAQQPLRLHRAARGADRRPEIAPGPVREDRLSHRTSGRTGASRDR